MTGPINIEITPTSILLINTVGSIVQEYSTEDLSQTSTQLNEFSLYDYVFYKEYYAVSYYSGHFYALAKNTEDNKLYVLVYRSGVSDVQALFKAVPLNLAEADIGTDPVNIMKKII